MNAPSSSYLCSPLEDLESVPPDLFAELDVDAINLLELLEPELFGVLGVLGVESILSLLNPLPSSVAVMIVKQINE
jgi:hypothetical protein